jgi:hypothetical protein
LSPESPASAAHRGGRGGRGGRSGMTGGRGRGRIPMGDANPPFKQATKYQGVASSSSSFRFQPVTLMPVDGMLRTGASPPHTNLLSSSNPQVSGEPGFRGNC